MSDTNERTLEVAEAQLNAELDARINASRSKVPTPGRKTSICRSCQDDIPDGRADAGYEICVTCAEIEETRNGRTLH